MPIRGRFRMPFWEFGRPSKAMSWPDKTWPLRRARHSPHENELARSINERRTRFVLAQFGPNQSKLYRSTKPFGALGGVSGCGFRPAPKDQGVRTSMTIVRVALANLRVPSSAEESVLLACAAIAEAGRKKAAVICFPECFVPGYRWPNSTIPQPNPAFLEKAWAAVGDAAGSARMAAILGTERVTDRGLQISACVFNPDGTVAGWQDKGQLDPDEEAIYPAAGTDRQVFTVGSLTFGIVICHEGWRYPETVRWAVRRGAQLVFHPHASAAEAGSYRPVAFADPSNTFHEKAVLCRAAENTCYFASVNCASEGSPTTSAIARPDGTLLCYQPYGRERILFADIDLSAATGLLASRCRISPL